MNGNKTIRRETVKSIHHMFLSDFNNGKENWFNIFMPVILRKLSTEEYAVKEEVYKLLDLIIDQINNLQLEVIVFSSNNSYCIFKIISYSLSTYETKPEILITIVNLMFKILSYYSLNNSL